MLVSAAHPGTERLADSEEARCEHDLSLHLLGRVFRSGAGEPAGQLQVQVQPAAPSFESNRALRAPVGRSLWSATQHALCLVSVSLSLVCTQDCSDLRDGGPAAGMR